MEGRRGLICRRDGSGAGHLVIRRQRRAPDGSFHTRLKLDTRAGGDALNSPEPKLRALEKTRCTYRPKKPPGTVARRIEVSQVHRVFSGAPSLLRCTEVSQVHRSCPSAPKFQWRIEGHSHGRGGGTPRAAQPPAIRFGPYGPSCATLENAFVFPQLRALAGSSPDGGPGRKNDPVAGAITRMVGAVGLEPTIPKAEDFKSPAYANSATPPCASKCTTPRRRRARTEPLRESAEPPRMRTARSTEQQPGPEALTLGTPPRQSGFMGQKACPINPPKLRKKFLNLALPFVSIGIHAGVAELADAYGSGPYGGNPVKVQVLSPAP